MSAWQSWNGGGFTPLFPFPVALATPTFGDIAFDAGSYLGCQFIAPITGTINEIWFRVGTNALTGGSIVLGSKICQLDASGFPIGTLVADSSETTSFDSSGTPDDTTYSHTISASVTAGNMYGLQTYVKTIVPTTGSLSVGRNLAAGGFGLTSSNQFPLVAYNVGGGDLKSVGYCAQGIKYATYGWVHCPPFAPIALADTTTTLSTSGNVKGNKFTVPYPITVVGYSAHIDLDNNCSIEMYSGSNNTAISGSSVSLTSAYRTGTGSNGLTVLLAAPLKLAAGTYRVGFKAGGSAIQTSHATFFEAGAQVQTLGMNVVRTEYASGAWTDTTTDACWITPLISTVGATTPPAYVLGV